MHAFADKLLAWFDRHGRTDLPWQQDTTPYRVWISEIMLQQTQVATVIPYYHRFIDRFPSVDALANASPDEVLHQWTGLGYYARARHLHDTAQKIMQAHKGEFPLTVDALLTLPGIGKSTAGAIVAICTGNRATILDGNAKRVLARCFAIAGWPGQTATSKALWAKAESLTPRSRVADYTQAMMDLGATVCTRRAPRCDQCPFADECKARAANTIALYPGRKPKATMPVKMTTMLVIEQDGQVLLERRNSAGLWGGLWSFPETEQLEYFLDDRGLTLLAREKLTPFRHTFTHFHLDITPIKVTVRRAAANVNEPGAWCWYDYTRPPEIGLTRPVTKILNALQSPPRFR